MPGKMVGRASVTQEPGSPAISLLEPSASNQNKRSSSRASRRSTRFPDLHLSNPSHLSNTSSNPSRSYSLPTTPIHSSFEEALPSTKRRRRRGSASYEGNKSNHLSESKDLSSGLAKSFGTSHTNSKPSPHSDKLSTGAQAPESTHPSPKVTQDQDSDPDKLSKEAQASQSTDTPKSNQNQDPNPDKLSTKAQASSSTDTPKSSRDRTHSDKLSNEAPTSQTTLHSFLKKSQDRRKSLASQADLTDSNKSDSNTSSHETSSGKRKTRKSMPAKTNGSGSQDTKTQRTASSSRASTPQSTKADRKSKSNAQASANSSAAMLSTPVAVSEPAAAPGSAAQLGKDKPVTPAPSRGFTPINSSRRTRKSVADLASQMHEQAGDAMEIDSTPSVIESSAKGSTRANRHPMSNTITLNVGRKALESVLPAALDTPAHSYDHEIADSVEATPVHVYGDSLSDNYHFDYTAEMYGHNYGLDGQVDGPTSPTSLATSTSTGARTSGRARKPTIRAMESIESQRRFQRKRTRTPAAKEEPTTNGNDADMPDANAKPTDADTDQAATHQNKKRKQKQPTDQELASPLLAHAPAHPTPAPSAVAHSVVSPSHPTYPASTHSASTPAPSHSAPARPASTASSPNHATMAPYAPTPPAPATYTPVPYAPISGTGLSTERVDVVMRLISVADDVLVAHPDAEEPEDDRFLEEMRSAFRQTHDLTTTGNLSSSGPVEPLPYEQQAEATKPKAAKPKPARTRAGKSRKVKARRAKATKASSVPAGGVKAKEEEATKGANRQLNEFGEEVVVVSRGYHWYRPSNTYGDGGLPQPPLRLKSDEQAEKDRIFGFPPRMGERNLPRAFSAPFSVENIEEERAKIRAREEARLRHIPVDRHMSTAEIRGLIEQYDSAGVPNPPNEKATRSSRKRRHVEGFGGPVESPQSRSRVGGGNSEVQVGPEPAITPSGPARPNLILKMPRPAAHDAKTDTKKRPSDGASGQPGKANKRQKVHQEASGGEGQGQSTEPTRLTLSFKNKHKQQPKLKLRQPATPKQPDTSQGVAEAAATPENPPQASPGHGSSSRPRRRAAAALMAEFENHAQERARRANARKKRAEGSPEEAQ